MPTLPHCPLPIALSRQAEPDTKALLLNTYAKLSHAYGEISASVGEVLRQSATAMDQEVQQRSVEYLALGNASLTTVKGQVLEMMPQFTERESIVQKALNKGNADANAMPASKEARNRDSAEADDDEDDGAAASRPTLQMGAPAAPPAPPPNLLGDDVPPPAAPSKPVDDLLGGLDLGGGPPAPPPAPPSGGDDLLGLMGGGLRLPRQLVEEPTTSSG